MERKVICAFYYSKFIWKKSNKSPLWKQTTDIVIITNWKNLLAVFGRNMNQAVVYYSGHWYHKDLIRAHILFCFAESSTPINKEKDHIISSGCGSTYTVVTFLPKKDICGLLMSNNLLTTNYKSISIIIIDAKEATYIYWAECYCLLSWESTRS